MHIVKRNVQQEIRHNYVFFTVNTPYMMRNTKNVQVHSIISAPNLVEHTNPLASSAVYSIIIIIDK